MTDAKPLAEDVIPGTGLRIVGLEAADLDGDGADKLFVSVYDQAFQPLRDARAVDADRKMAQDRRTSAS